MNNKIKIGSFILLTFIIIFILYYLIFLFMIGKIGQSNKVFEWDIGTIETENILIKTTSVKMRKIRFANLSILEFKIIVVNKINQNICFYASRIYVSKENIVKASKYSPENSLYPNKFNGNTEWGAEGKIMIPPGRKKNLLVYTPALNLDDRKPISLKLVIRENPIAIVCPKYP
jgi:hypothetical protein